ncbi:NAD(P)H-dependent oxidoreductase [Pirellulales bacterium]|nr:NAD(P)H-dependent oxidoreductase [Pirellulales bacterium]
MTYQPKIIALAGSLRRESFNKKLVHVAADAARDAGGDVHVVDLRDYPLPVFDQDLEASEGPPNSVVELKKLMIPSDGLLIASPEYNSSVTGALKNMIDWVSRKADDESPLAAFSGKTAAILAASPGGLGGLRGLNHLRDILGNIGMLVLPDQLAISLAHQAFDDDGTLKDPKQRDRTGAIARRLVEVSRQLKGGNDASTS